MGKASRKRDDIGQLGPVFDLFNKVNQDEIFDGLSGDLNFLIRLGSPMLCHPFLPGVILEVMASDVRGASWNFCHASGEKVGMAT